MNLQIQGNLFLCFLLLCLSHFLQAQNPPLGFPDSIYTKLEEGISVYPMCNDDTVSFEEVSGSAFQNNFKEGIGFTQGCRHWLKLKLFLPKEATGYYLLRQPDWDGHTVYYFPTADGSYEKAYSGLTVPPSQRSFNYPKYNKAKALLIGGDTLSIFLLIDFEADEYMKAPRLSIRKLTLDYVIDKESEHGLLMMTLATVLLLAIYNIAIFAYTRDSAYLFYSLMFLFLMPYLVFVGMEVWYWVASDEWTAYAGHLCIFSGCLSGCCYLCFSILYLDGKKELPIMSIWAKWVALIGGFLIVLAGSSTFVTSYGNGNILLIIGNIALLASFILILAFSVLLSFKGSKTARYYIWATISFLPFLCIFFMQGPSAEHYGYLGWIEGNEFTVLSLKIAVVVQALAFSLALAARISLLRKQVTEQALQVERSEKVRLLEIQQLIEKQNKELEGKVQSRTQSLQEAVEELKVSEESLDRLNKTKDHFFALIAHDLRGPVASFQGLASILQHQIKKNKIDRVQQMMTQVDGAANQLNILLDNLLQWAQTQIGGVNYQPKEVALQPLLEDIERVYAGTALSKSIHAQIDIMPANLSVHADYPSTATILRNLWSNALKFTENGKVTCTARLENNHVHIIIADTGIGIPQEKLTNLFEIDPTKSTKGTQGEKGNGLGLLLCQEFVERNKGRIWATSELGKGTEMHLYLPKYK